MKPTTAELIAFLRAAVAFAAHAARHVGGMDRGAICPDAFEHGYLQEQLAQMYELHPREIAQMVEVAADIVSRSLDALIADLTRLEGEGRL